MVCSSAILVHVEEIFRLPNAARVCVRVCVCVTTQVASMQRDSSTYCDEPSDTEDYTRWKGTFSLDAAKPQVCETHTHTHTHKHTNKHTSARADRPSVVCDRSLDRSCAMYDNLCAADRRNPRGQQFHVRVTRAYRSRHSGATGLLAEVLLQVSTNVRVCVCAPDVYWALASVLLCPSPFDSMYMSLSQLDTSLCL